MAHKVLRLGHRHIGVALFTLLAPAASCPRSALPDLAAEGKAVAVKKYRNGRMRGFKQHLFVAGHR